MSSSDRAEGEYSLTDPVSAPQGKGTPPRVDRDSRTVGESAGGFVGASNGLAIHLAGRNPEYAGRAFEDVDSDLRCGWNDDAAEQCGEWPAVRRYAHVAFDRARREPRANIEQR